MTKSRSSAKLVSPTQYVLFANVSWQSICAMLLPSYNADFNVHLLVLQATVDKEKVKQVNTVLYLLIASKCCAHSIQ